MATKQTGQWTLPSQNGLDSLQYDADATKSEQDLGPHDVLVELRAASLNYRDIVTIKVSVEQNKKPLKSIFPPSKPQHRPPDANNPNQGNIGTPMSLEIIPSLIPGSDGSGRILAIGSAVSSTRPDLQPGVDGTVPDSFFPL